SFKNNVDILEIFSQSSVVYHPKMINSISKIQSVMMFLSPLIVIATLNMLQMLMTLFFKPMYSYMFNISLLSIGFLSDSIFASSRCAMPIYSDIFLIGGFDIKGAFVLCAILIAISVINALAGPVSFLELVATNIIFALVIWLCEGNKWIKHTACKLVQYDKINLVTPDKYDEMVADLKKRLGLDIVKVEIGAVDFLRDMAVLKVYYKPQNDDVNTIDGIIKLNKEQWAQKDS
ncbi:MAG: DUF4956 domain-containing protein, partial [Muribaculaceae bacterium]|nr:DUF4956 domain-containing protein [Muribaculaceae bacterium]